VTAQRYTADEVLAELRAKGNPDSVGAMAHFGIATSRALGGWPVPELRALAKRVGRDHHLALALWESGIHEARELAPMVDRASEVTEAQMESWAADFDSWDIVDGCCGGLFIRTPWAYEKAFAWSRREEEFVKRAGLVLMAYLAVHDKQAPDEKIASFLPVLEREAWDERNFVKKATNWALRQIGKRSLALNGLAIESALRIKQQGTRSARWIAADALRELRGGKVQARLQAKSQG
jgi:3-methyladenine DNA glycosylase AlkD